VSDDVRAAQHNAVDLPRLRDRLVDSLENGAVAITLEHTDAPLRLPLMAGPLGPRRMRIPQWCSLLLATARTAPLYYVTREITELTQQAAAAMPFYRVYADRIPSTTGIVVFGDTVIDVPEEHLAPGERVMINAFMWLPVSDTGDGPGVACVTWQDTDVLLAHQPELHLSGPQRAYTDRVMRSRYGPLAYHDEYLLPFGDRPYGIAADRPVANTATATVLCTWALMNQRLTHVRDEPLPRAVRKAAQRAGRPEPAVRIVELRTRTTRRAPEDVDPQQRDPDAPARVYTKRWVVQGYGYWRDTWYPSRQRHEQQFVHVPSYVKGPEGAPLVGGERVNVLRHGDAAALRKETSA
jgi:hypothetical protein